jgi:hypothetical protein
MADVAVYAFAPELREYLANPSYERLIWRVRTWRNAAYLGIGSFSLTWPVAAFLRSM